MHFRSIRPVPRIRDDATQAHRPDVFVSPCVNVRHMLPSVDLNFKSTLKSDLRASTLIDTHRSVIEPEVSLPAVNTANNTQSRVRWRFSASYSIIWFFVQYNFFIDIAFSLKRGKRKSVYVCVCVCV